MKKCPPGIICIEPYMFTLLVCIIIIILGYIYNKQFSVNNENTQNLYSEINLLKKKTTKLDSINNELENMSFEDAINELEKIVDELEGNEISLDEAVNAYERGSKLKNICQERLNEAKMKVEKIKDFDKDEI